ncbi:MerR family transcriptional regulator [Haloplasma contractile]|uniref:GTP pyrophosphokinase protein n=1 Tax=Haloplasma contractile SSD-17B TaxID=1033810 RepID=U2FJG0_9MOLU|nr:MerR family transcriptional regulator [Haloplasma contractile]ERJ11399.1 GTP pyrophosphokinase protein [Haloplasma contractile SSD-17B]
MTTYRTIDLAREGNIHTNTVRLYEKNGFISPVPRDYNGYRMFSQRHLYQIKIIRCIFDYDWLGKTLRSASLKIIKSVAEWDLEQAWGFTQTYIKLIDKDYLKAQKTIKILEKWVLKEENEIKLKTYTRKEVANLIGVTPEVLRNWDRNGLIEVPRVGPNNTRVYGNKEIERLRIIYMLRQARFSISAILQSLKHYDESPDNIKGVINALNTPKHEEYQSWISVGDRWITGLENASEGAKNILSLINEIKEEII